MLHTAEVTREVNFEIRGNPWNLTFLYKRTEQNFLARY